jgi:hypothetical protein
LFLYYRHWVHLPFTVTWSIPGRGNKIIPNRPGRLCGHVAGYRGLFSLGVRWPGREPDTHLYILPKLRVDEAIPSLSHMPFGMHSDSCTSAYPKVPKVDAKHTLTFVVCRPLQSGPFSSLCNRSSGSAVAPCEFFFYRV